MLARAFSGDRRDGAPGAAHHVRRARWLPGVEAQFNMHIGWKPGDGIRIPFEVIIPTTLGRD